MNDKMKNIGSKIIKPIQKPRNQQLQQVVKPIKNILIKPGLALK